MRDIELGKNIDPDIHVGRAFLDRIEVSEIKQVAQLQRPHRFAGDNAFLVVPDGRVAPRMMLDDVFDLRQVGFGKRQHQAAHALVHAAIALPPAAHTLGIGHDLRDALPRRFGRKAESVAIDLRRLEIAVRVDLAKAVGQVDAQRIQIGVHADEQHVGRGARAERPVDGHAQLVLQALQRRFRGLAIVAAVSGATVTVGGRAAEMVDGDLEIVQALAIDHGARQPFDFALRPVADIDLDIEQRACIGLHPHVRPWQHAEHIRADALQPAIRTRADIHRVIAARPQKVLIERHALTPAGLLDLGILDARLEAAEGAARMQGG